MSAHWTHLIRFESDGSVQYGDAIFPQGKSSHDVVSIAQSGELRAKLIEGDPLSGTSTLTDREVSVDKLLGPLTMAQVPLIRCIGLNYMKHIQEGGRTPPPYPSIFVKPATSLADYNADVLIPKIAQETLDYEGELTIVIGRAARDVSEANALDYIAGYVCSNDVSCRVWQRDPAYAGGVPQWCFSKGFDAFAPIGPMIVSPAVLGAADKLGLKTMVNGSVRQDSSTSDMLFGVRRIVAFASQGTTLQAGSLIMTGTPSGVGFGMNPKGYLGDGDVVEVSIEGLGTLKNTMKFE